MSNQFNFREIFKALKEGNVDYVVVGGLAVILHGYLRATSDLDLILNLDADNVGNAIYQLKKLGLQPRLPVAIDDFANSAMRREWAETRNMLVFQLWDPENPIRSIDLFIHEPIPFDQLKAAAITKKLDNLDVRVASIDHLIELKQSVLRVKDIQDIAELKKIKNQNDD